MIVSPDNHHSYFQFSLPDKLEPLSPQVSTDRLSQMPISILQTATDIYKNNAHNLFESPTQAVPMDGSSNINQQE